MGDALPSPPNLQKHVMDAKFKNGYQVSTADMDGDGRKELINMPSFGTGTSAPECAVTILFRAYRVPTDPTTACWASALLDDTLSMAHELHVARGARQVPAR
jgi:hypothetical protein